MAYNWQLKNWPNFKFDVATLNDDALLFSKSMGEITGVSEGLAGSDKIEALVRLMIEEAMKTSAIEGEMLNRQDVMSSIKNNLGLNKKPANVKDKKAKAVADLMIAVRNNYNKKLSTHLIKEWHKILFGESKTAHAGKWRTGKAPMQVVSGKVGKEMVHYEAPPSTHVAAEMNQFVAWYNNYKTNGNIAQAMAKSAIAHLYFESIHPFEDGNGRIGRAIAEKCLAESIGSPVLLSLSGTIEKKRKLYYAALKEAQSTLNINPWLEYFARVVLDAQQEALKMVKHSLKRSQFFDTYKSDLNTRETKVVQKMLDAGSDGFEGGMTAKKYISITKTSKATATRDLQHLTELGVLQLKGGGRSVFYELNI